MKPSASLDKWRDYFRRGDSDIFGIINHAIMVAAADSPKEFKSRRGEIAELLFSCKVSRCIGCDHLELSIAEDEKAVSGPRTVENVGVGGGGGNGYDFRVATDDGGDKTKLNELGEEASGIIDEVMRIKDILLNKDDEPNSVLFESLKKLASISMTMSVDILKDTEIGKAVNGLRRHSSDQISKLAKTLFAEWKELVDRWMNTPKEEMTGAEGTTPESALDEELVFPSPPHDLDFFTPEQNGYDLAQILDCLDCDGNPRDSLVSEPDRKLQSSMRRKPEGTIKANVVGRYNKDGHMRREEADVRPMKHSATEFDEPRSHPKQSREQIEPTIQRKSLVSEQKQKLTGSQQDKLKALDPDAKFEFAKRKLQESYRQHENAKRQRTIQVLEMIPMQSKSQKPQLKRPIRR